MKTTARNLPLGFEGQRLPYAGLAFSIAFLNFLTIGLYKPYGLTRMRRALYNRITVGGEALAYVGDAKGQGRVTFYPSLALLFLLVGPGVLQFYVDFSAAIAIGVVQLGMLVVFAHYLAYRARQYELMSVEWRGQPFYLTGSAATYMWAAFGLQVANLLTLGFITPWRRVKLAELQYQPLHHGNVAIKAAFTSKPLWLPYLLGWLAALVGTAVLGYFFWQSAGGPAWQLYHGGPVNPAMAAEVQGIGAGVPGGADPIAMAELGTWLHLLFGIFIYYPLWRLLRLACFAVYEAAYWRQLAAALSCGPLGLRFDGSVMGLLMLNAVSYVANFFTANLTRPFTTYQKARYFVGALTVTNAQAALRS